MIEAKDIAYKGKRFVDGDYSSDNIVLFTHDGGKNWEELDWGLKWINHSPTGLNWGYYGSGCAQLAFAILMDFYQTFYLFEEEKAYKFLRDGKYQLFKQDFVAGWKDEWELNGEEIKDQFYGVPF